MFRIARVNQRVTVSLMITCTKNKVEGIYHMTYQYYDIIFSTKELESTHWH